MKRRERIRMIFAAKSGIIVAFCKSSVSNKARFRDRPNTFGTRSKSDLPNLRRSISLFQ